MKTNPRPLCGRISAPGSPRLAGRTLVLSTRPWSAGLSCSQHVKMRPPASPVTRGAPQYRGRSPKGTHASNVNDLGQRERCSGPESAAVRVGWPASPHGPAGPASESSGRRWREKWTRSQCGWQERGLGDRGSGPWCGWGGESAGAARGETVQEPELEPTPAQAGQGPPRRSDATPQGGGHVSLGTK